MTKEQLMLVRTQVRKCFRHGTDHAGKSSMLCQTDTLVLQINRASDQVSVVAIEIRFTGGQDTQQRIAEQDDIAETAVKASVMALGISSTWESATAYWLARSGCCQPRYHLYTNPIDSVMAVFVTGE